MYWIYAHKDNKEELIDESHPYEIYECPTKHQLDNSMEFLKARRFTILDEVDLPSGDKVYFMLNAYKDLT